MESARFEARFGSRRKQWALTALKEGTAAYDSEANYRGLARRDNSYGTICYARHDHVVAHARRTLPDVEGVQHAVLHGKDVFLVEDFGLLSFNLLDKHHLVRGNRTRQSHQFLNQGNVYVPRLLLREMPNKLLKIVAGYTLNNVLQPKEYWLVCPEGRKNLWEIPLSEPPMFSIFDLPVSPAPMPPALPFRFREDVEEQIRDEERKRATDESVE